MSQRTPNDFNSGSFLSPAQRQAFEKEAMEQRDNYMELMRQRREGQQAHAPHAEDAPTSNAEGPLLSKSDTTWDGQGKPPEVAKKEEKKEEKEPTYKDKEGHERCSSCHSVLARNEKTPISDEELLAYMSGSPIEKRFHIGRLGLSIRSMSQDELDYVLYRLTSDIKKEEFPGASHAANRQSLYQLVFSLTARGVYSDRTYRLTPELDPFAAKDFIEREKRFDTKLHELRALGHQVLLEFSRCQAALENSIKTAMEDEQNIKNY